MRDPWKRQRAMEPEREYLAMASLIPAKQYSATIELFRGARVTKKQLRATEGLVGFSLLARPLRKQYGTLSVWEDREALDRFTNASPHKELMKDLAPLMAETVFTTWNFVGRDGRPTWATAFDQLRQASNSGGHRRP